MHPDFFFTIENPKGGKPRMLAHGIAATIYSGQRAMVSVVRFAANAKGTMHQHPEEQWGFCVSGSGVRYQGDAAVPVKPGDFWLTPGNLAHTMEAGREGMVVLDIFAPPREEYTRRENGFGGEP